MNIIACLAFAVICSIDASWAQNGIDDVTNNAIGFFAPALSGAIASVQSQAEPSVATIADANTTPTPQPSATSSTTPSTTTSDSSTTSSTKSSSSTTSSGKSSSSTTSSSKSSSSTTSSSKSSFSTTSSSKSSSLTTSAAKASSSTTSAAPSASATASPSHHSSAKIGVGVGVPLGICFLAVIGFLLVRHRRHKEVSRLRHHGIIAAAGLYPVNDESNDGPGGTDQRNMTDVENGSDSQGHEKDDVHEILGTEIPHHSRELIGSPGVPRQEMGSRRSSL